MFGLFKKNPTKKLEKEYELLMAKARDVQRSGDLKAYALIIEKSEIIMNKIDAINNEGK